MVVIKGPASLSNGGRPAPGYMAIGAEDQGSESVRAWTKWFKSIRWLYGGYTLAQKGTLWWTYKKPWKMAIEIVDFPIKNGDFPLLC